MNSSLIREQARLTLSGRWKNAIWVTFIAALFGAVLTTGTSFEFNFNIDEDDIEIISESVLQYIKITASIGGVLGIVQFILGGVIQLGYCKYLLNLVDGDETQTNDLFSQFHRFQDAFVMNLLRGIYVVLWSMLFVIPGIIATLKYAMTPFIMLENPGLRPNDAITESKNMMNGFKGNLFLLLLSFIGWSFLCVFTLGIGNLWLTPYMNVSYALFYRTLCPKKNIPVEEYPSIEYTGI